MTEEFRMVAIDTETTGFSFKKGARMIEVGCVEIINRKLTGKTYTQRYSIPLDTEMADGAFDVHGISVEDLANEPRFEDSFHELLAFVGKSDIVGHRISFDLGFLDFELSRLPRDILNKYTTDSEVSFERLVRVDRNHRSDHCTGKMSIPVCGQYMKLDQLCDRFKIDRSHRVKHGALLDAELCALCYLAMTRGNADMFVEHVQEPQEIIRIDRDDVKPLIVIKATDEELAAEQEMYGWMVDNPFKGKH